MTQLDKVKIFMILSAHNLELAAKYAASAEITEQQINAYLRSHLL